MSGEDCCLSGLPYPSPPQAPPRSRCPRGTEYTRNVLGEMSARENGEGDVCVWKSFPGLSHAVERERKESWVRNIFRYSSILGKFLQGQGENLSWKCLSEESGISQECVCFTLPDAWGQARGSMVLSSGGRPRGIAAGTAVMDTPCSRRLERWLYLAATFYSFHCSTWSGNISSLFLWATPPMEKLRRRLVGQTIAPKLQVSQGHNWKPFPPYSRYPY